MSGREEFYGKSQATRILTRAIQDSVSGDISRESIIAAATALGMSEEALLRAEAGVAGLAIERPATDWATFQRHSMKQLGSSLLAFVIGNCIVIGIWSCAGKGYFWPSWWLAGSTISLLRNVVNAIGGDRKAKFERWKEKQGAMVSPEVQAFLDEIVPVLGPQKLQTTKAVKDHFGFELRESKELVDIYYRTHPVPDIWGFRPLGRG